MQDLHQFDVKVFATKAENIGPYDLMRVFQRWIQKHTIPGVLIDAADYSHMHNGPGVILVAHEFNVSLDRVGGRPGMLYHQKQPLEGDFAARIGQVIQSARTCAGLLQGEPEMKDKLAFDLKHFLFIANDRARTPDIGSLRASVEEAARSVVGGGVSLEVRKGDPRERVAIEVRAA
ncbi:MAG: hypothetical protein AAB353_10690 [Candidatus Hydrogenedentota bacterium]